MKATPREGRRITYSTEIRNLKKRLALNETQRAVVIGSILGDGGLVENWSKSNYRLKIDHSIKQEEYLRWKYGTLREWFLSEPRYYDKTKSVTIRTISHRELTALRKIFYQGKQKVVPENLEEYLDPLVIAVWFMDDGNAIRIKNKEIVGYHLNTQSFTDGDNNKIAEVLAKQFDIICTPQRNHGKYRLYIGARGRRSLEETVRPFIVPSMQYKISCVRDSPIPVETPSDRRTPLRVPDIPEINFNDTLAPPHTPYVGDEDIVHAHGNMGTP